MDFTGLAETRISYTLNAITDVITMSFKNPSDVEIGTVVIERVKLRSLLESLAEIGQEILPDLTVDLGSRKTSFNLNEKAAKILFE
jgi:hypothetical protein